MPQTELTGLYRSRLSQAQTGLLARLASLWAATFNPDDPLSSIALISTAAASLVTGGQAVAAADATAYLRALTADAAAEQFAAIAPYAVPPGLVGSTAAGMPMGQLTGIASTVYESTRRGGADPAGAATSAYGWINRVAASEPYRAANATVTGNAASDDRLSGRVNRITAPGACDFCRKIADRGYIQHGSSGNPMTFAAHAHCNCTASPEISSYATSRRAIDRARRAQAQERRPAVTVPKPREFPELTPRERAGLTYDLEGFGNADPALADAATSAVDTALGPLSPNYRANFTAVIRQPGPQFEQARGITSSTYAYYETGTGEVTVREGLGNAVFDRDANRLEADGWWTPTGLTHSAGSLQRTLGHEVGHYVEDHLSFEQVAEVQKAAIAADARVSSTKTAAKVVSKYGATSSHEMIAECWTEYVFNPYPRPVAKAVGDKIVEFLG